MWWYWWNYYSCNGSTVGTGGGCGGTGGTTIVVGVHNFKLYVYIIYMENVAQL